MNKKFKTSLLKNINIIVLIFLTILTILISTYFNYEKKLNNQK